MRLIPDGYKVVRLNGDAVFRLRDRLGNAIGHLQSLWMHDEDITAEQVAASKQLHAMSEWREVLLDNEELFLEAVGEEILYQREPYLRVARPGRLQDQIGIHRDTHYGASSHEWVLWIPLTDATDGAELRILPGSHLKDEDAYPWTQASVPACERGSEKHWLGFRYAPKRMSAEVEAQTVPVPCPLGSAILFNSACVHGQIVNRAPWTRVSIDVRLVDASAPIEWTRGLRGSLYEPLRVAA
jgi:ectoine hydroxylase-related dioxygenase (phytanoyl-CoA dioxygenase family)